MDTEEYLQILITTQFLITAVELIRLYLSLKSKFKRKGK